MPFFHLDFGHRILNQIHEHHHPHHHEVDHDHVLPYEPSPEAHEPHEHHDHQEMEEEEGDEILEEIHHGTGLNLPLCYDSVLSPPVRRRQWQPILTTQFIRPREFVGPPSTRMR